MFSPYKFAPETIAAKIHNHSMAKNRPGKPSDQWPVFVTKFAGKGNAVYITRTEVTDQRLSSPFPFWLPNGIV